MNYIFPSHSPATKELEKKIENNKRDRNLQLNRDKRKKL